MVALLLLAVRLLSSWSLLASSVKIENQAIAEYEYDMAAAYGVSGRTEISNDNLQRIVKGAQQGNRGDPLFLFLFYLLCFNFFCTFPYFDVLGFVLILTMLLYI
jgi:hypothetical protein